MKNSKHSSLNNYRKIKSRGSNKKANAKARVISTINGERNKPAHRIWEKEPTAEFRQAERLKRVRFLRKYGKRDPELNIIADCLDRNVRLMRNGIAGFSILLGV
ncbi:MAG: hypothetical protein WA322_00815 [Pseudolabrys sp.]